MCRDCVDMFGGFAEGVATPEVAAVATAITAFYQLPDCGTGGPLHVVLDDFNVEDDVIAWCVEHANDDGYYPPQVTAAATELVAMLRPLTVAQRARACWDAEG